VFWFVVVIVIPGVIVVYASSLFPSLANGGNAGLNGIHGKGDEGHMAHRLKQRRETL